MKADKGGAVRFPQEFFDVAESIDPGRRAEVIRKAAQLGLERMKPAQKNGAKVTTLPFLGQSQFAAGEVHELKVPASPVFTFVPIGLSIWSTSLEQNGKEEAPIVEVSELRAHSGEGRNLLAKGWRDQREFEGASGILHLEEVDHTPVHLRVESDRDALVFVLLQVEVSREPFAYPPVSSKPDRMVRINGVPDPRSPNRWIQEEIVQRDLVLRGLDFEEKNPKDSFDFIAVEGGASLLACQEPYPVVLARQIRLLHPGVCKARNRAVVDVNGTSRPVFLFEELA